MTEENRYRRQRSVILRTETETDRRVERKKRSKKHEKRIAKELGGKRQPGSGSLEDAKGDVTSADALYDHKFTDKLIYSIKQDDLAKLCMEAQEMGKDVPVLVIKFDSPIEKLKWMMQSEWAVIPMDTLRRILSSRSTIEPNK